MNAPARCATGRSSNNQIKTSSGVAKVRRSSRFPSCSSIAEHPADNRKTQERYLPGRPTLTKNVECKVQNDGRSCVAILQRLLYSAFFLLPSSFKSPE